MADNADRAAERTELILNAGLSHRAPEPPPATGRCLNCEEPLDAGMRWCDADCKEDWERRQAKKQAA